jgi:ribonuclease P protein component
MDSIGVRKSDRRTAFPKNLRLLKRAEFRKVYEQGERRSGQLAAIFWRPNGLDRCRLGITVPARVGNAVVRNRIKRRVREVFRREGSSIPAGWDVVLNPRASTAQVPFSTLRRELLRLFPSRPAEKPQAAGAPSLDEREAK